MMRLTFRIPLGRTQVALAVSAVIALAVSVGVAAASATAQRVELRLYDPSRVSKVEVTTVDVIRSSARAVPQSGGSAILIFQLTKQGGIHFHALTFALARRGARLHRDVPFAFAIDRRVYAKPVIDYRAFPNGLYAAPGIQMTNMPLALARRLANQIRHG